MENNIQLAQTAQNSNISRPYEESASMTRRNFLRLAGLAGVGVISGCMALPVEVRRDFKYSDYPETYSVIESEPLDKDNLKLTDLIFKKDELGGMRLAQGRWEKLFATGLTNPSIGRSKEHSLGAVYGAPQCDMWIFAEYISQMNYPLYRILTLGNEFKREEDFEKAKAKLKEIIPTLKKKGEFARFYSKFPFVGGVAPSLAGKECKEDLYIKLDYTKRSEIYAEKRGLEFVAGTY